MLWDIFDLLRAFGALTLWFAWVNFFNSYLIGLFKNQMSRFVITYW
jgi:hypothetical protein